ncbi:hypothetical protein GCM10022197_24150 [Microlunatus spumicola]|uniref:DUF4240 domain-containing protein n=1 Tax=Microlunatus spumicola TaxID=81499 RepID=A0ABP6XHC0_9ACTN
MQLNGGGRPGRGRTIRTLDHAHFWAVVAAMGPELIPARMFMTLSALGWEERQAFCEHLRQVEDALTSDPHERSAATAWELLRPGPGRAGAEDHDDRGRAEQQERHRPRLPAEAADLRLTVVAHGYDAWAAVVAVPTLLGGAWPTALGRSFSLTVAQACGTKTGSVVRGRGVSPRPSGAAGGPWTKVV